MLPGSVISVRDSLKKKDRPYRLFFDNAQIVNSITDVISWNDDLNVIHVVRNAQDPTINKDRAIEVLTFGYEDIRSISYFVNTEEIAECMTALAGIGADEYSAERGAKIEKYFKEKLSGQNESMY